ncbi:MAG: ABC transporter ATP-binding protein, partial [Phycisphaerales bacterium]|nr:ABC transporter ATP-binding protein [Phycisphaerales bacterium]
MPLIGTNLSFAYPKGPRVLDAVSCTIEPGTITAIIGPNGAGKSTLIRLLAGLASPDQGHVQIDQTRLDTLNGTKRASRLAYIAQRSSLAFDFDVRLVVSFGRLALPKDPAAVERALERFGLAGLASKPMGTLSVGQQQRVSLARGWAQLDGQENAYLLADEPTSAMDPKYQLQTMHAFQELALRGIGVALVAHDLSLSIQFADRAIVLDREGAVRAQGAVPGGIHPCCRGGNPLHRSGGGIHPGS